MIIVNKVLSLIMITEFDNVIAASSSAFLLGPVC